MCVHSSVCVIGHKAIKGMRGEKDLQGGYEAHITQSQKGELTGRKRLGEGNRKTKHNDTYTRRCHSETHHSANQPKKLIRK